MQTVQSTKHVNYTLPAQPPILTRELLAAGAEAVAHHDKSQVHLLSETERDASLTRFMRKRPAGDLWVFAYGSLVWNPAMRVAERRVARVQGWHRSFCLSMAVGRGTPQEPGLVLGLDRGRACDGLAYRIAEQDIASELPILWRREMLVGGYIPTWLDVTAKDGESFGSAITFVIDRTHANYAGSLPRNEKVCRLATAAGTWGSSSDYLFRTIAGLREHGIRDQEVEHLGDLVNAIALEDMDEAA